MRNEGQVCAIKRQSILDICSQKAVIHDLQQGATPSRSGLLVIGQGSVSIVFRVRIGF